MALWKNQIGRESVHNSGDIIEPAHIKVLLVVFDPVVKASGEINMIRAMGWNEVDILASKYIADIRECSHDYARFSVVDRIQVDSFPIKEDGYKYDGREFLGMMRKGRGFHKADQVDYHQILKSFQIIDKINSGAIDEVWLFGPPYAGFYESRMAGPGAFFCNSPPLLHTNEATRRFIIMGFNYERRVGEMLESFGHRAESIMSHVYRNHNGEGNLWERFTRHEATHPGKSEVGTVHFAPNSTYDYDWGSPRQVLSRCKTWNSFPDLSGEPELVDCHEWGGGDIHLHHKWWLSHIPYVSGEIKQVSNNWWEYLIDPNRGLVGS